MVMHAEIFTSYTRMSNLKVVVRYSTAVLCNDLLNLISLSLFLSKGGSSVDAEGKVPLDVLCCYVLGAGASYYFRYYFFNLVPMGKAGSAVKKICSSS